MLIGSYSVLLKTPGRFFGGNPATMPAAFGTSGANRNRYSGEAGIDPRAAMPLGYAPGYGWVPPIKAGGIAAFETITGSGQVAGANLAGGLGAASALAGSGAITDAAAGLIVQAVAALSGIGGLSGAVAGALFAAATLAGAGNVTAALGALASAVASITGAGAVTGSVSALGSMSAEITPFTELSPQGLAAAVWNAVAASFNGAGSMGEKVNAAGTAGDPWTAAMGTYAAGSAGAALVELYRLAGLDPTKPLVVTTTSRKVPADGTDIEQTIVDVSGTVTVQRV